METVTFASLEIGSKFKYKFDSETYEKSAKNRAKSISGDEFRSIGQTKVIKV